MLRYDLHHRHRTARVPVKVLMRDNEVVVRSIASSSDHLNCECFTMSGLDEICASSHNGPSLIFVDGTLQGYDIPETCRLIRLSYPKRAAYIVLIIPRPETSKKYFDIR